MMKHCTGVILIICMTAVLTACGSPAKSGETAAEASSEIVFVDPGIEKAEEVVLTFLSSLDKGQYKQAASCCSDELIKSMGIDSLDQTIIDTFAEGIGYTEDPQISEDSRKKIIDFAGHIMDETIAETGISGETTEEDGQYTVPAYIVCHEPPEEDESDEIIDSTVEKITSDQEKVEALSRIFMEEGHEALYDQVIEDLFPDLEKEFVDLIGRTETSREDITLTVRKQNGNWLITDASDNLASIPFDIFR